MDLPTVLDSPAYVEIEVDDAPDTVAGAELAVWGNIRRLDEDAGKPGGGEGDLVLVGLVNLNGNWVIVDLVSS